MRKFSRVFRTIIELFYTKDYPAKIKRHLAWTLVQLEWKAHVNSGKGKPMVSQKIVGFTFYAFNYKTMLVLFREIFLVEEYNSAFNGPNPTILDCGANIGMATLYFKWRYPQATIHSFEPDTTTFNLLRKNVEENQLKNVTLSNQAVADYTGTIVFYNEVSNPGSLLMSTRSDRHPDNKIEVPCIRLSDVITELGTTIDIAKIDIEGAEFPLFRDLTATGSLTKIKELFIEYHHKIGDEKSKLSTFLEPLESSGFEYELNTTSSGFGKFQDMLLHCIRG